VKKAVVILGAGASCEFIKTGEECLSTSYLTDSLYSKENWTAVIQKYGTRNAHFGRATFNCDLDNIHISDVTKALELIRTLLKSGSRPGYSEIDDFEHTIHLLDRISVIVWADKSPVEVGLEGLLPYCFGKNFFDKCLLAESDTDGWLYVPFLAREIVASAIIDLWKRREDKEKSLSSFGKLLLSIHDSFEETNIFSFNYDPLLYESIKHTPYLERQSGFSTNGFDAERFLNTSKGIMAFVHGCIGFIPEAEKMRFCEDWAEAQDSRFRNLKLNTPYQTSAFAQGQKGMQANTYLVTGLDKIDAFSAQPFSSYMFRFARDIEEADVIFIIGYSLRDSHIDHLLSNIRYLAYKRTRNFIFVTHASETDIANQFDSIISYNQGIVQRIVQKLDNKFSSNESTGVKNASVLHKKKIRSSLVENGYTQLFDNVTLFNEGTKKFIEKYDEVMKSISTKSK